MKPASLLATVLAAITGFAPVASRAAAPPRPNFVVVLINDMGLA